MRLTRPLVELDDGVDDDGPEGVEEVEEYDAEFEPELPEDGQLEYWLAQAEDEQLDEEATANEPWLVGVQ